MDSVEFEKLVAEAFTAFPKKLRDSLYNVEIVIEDTPRHARSDEILIAHNQVLLGLYQGVPQTVWGKNGSGILPDKITIFKEPIEKLATSDEHLKELVRDVVWHELGHHFGFTDVKLRVIEQRRALQKKKKDLQ